MRRTRSGTREAPNELKHECRAKLQLSLAVSESSLCSLFLHHKVSFAQFTETRDFGSRPSPRNQHLA